MRDLYRRGYRAGKAEAAAEIEELRAMLKEARDCLYSWNAGFMARDEEMIAVGLVIRWTFRRGGTITE